MKRRLVSFFLVLLLVLLACSPFLLLAAQLPVLADAAKQKPQGSGVGEKVAAGVKPVLGQSGNISSIKTRPGGTTADAVWLPDVSKKISSKSAIIIDAETGETLYALSPDTPRQPASTIKVLTGMIAIKSLDDGEWVGVSSRASGMPRSKVYLDTKKSYRASDLINAVLLASANDASVALAEKIAGSEEKFGEMMNLRARLWGAKNTVCRTASGLTAQGQQSTARDLANIFRHAMQDENFARRMGRVKLRTSYGKLLRNHNKALWTVKGAEGGKTGYTRAARQTYVGQFAGDQGKIVVAIMGSESMWDDVEKLVDYGFKRQEKLARLRSKGESREVALAR
ncbi:MAG TPA: D-alanyl-D-alanine carboxypeptidase [Desulfobacteraceae bacterium]|nr:D-alanyl-D-alanine carboxypeptidase [Desulfobacteraceae bacterium]